jgi:hypothetical protein
MTPGILSHQAARGNPVKSGTVEMTEATIRNIIASHQTPRKHAKAMSIEAMNAIFNWSLSECPSDPQVALNTGPMTADTVKTIMLHLLWQAFSSLAFKLWTWYALPLAPWFASFPIWLYRNFEITQITWADLD